ncbi:hypothetical protein [Streptomyces rochei]|uniref:hypothetical protein n=1 Tax=Streptomyces rochei TaxID=1928 RepID=UPI0037030C6B
MAASKKKTLPAAAKKTVAKPASSRSSSTTSRSQMPSWVNRAAPGTRAAGMQRKARKAGGK